MAHYVGLGCAVAALLHPLVGQAQTAPVISCSTDPAIFNTGIDGSKWLQHQQPQAGAGSLDAHWSIASALGDITTPAAAAALSYAQGPVDRPGAGNGAGCSRRLAMPNDRCAIRQKLLRLPIPIQPGPVR
ncbi:hypothetical protein [Comamonas sp. JC664]|uniref:hypothetical protein n=1 Tax=Comamonas sp. JC664 TaxID=2801917 RepID=UPI003613943F